ncbi:MAG: sulfurtransferase TusA family protein [Rhodobacteraceae bacterium]|nr:sulfurtransferase TusA family protein [Paracoccaceae bacterium]
MDPDAEIDARGLLCPLPVLKAQKRLRSMPAGALLRLVATDPASWVDVPHFCRAAGHDLVAAEEAGDVRIYLIRAGGGAGRAA